MFHVEVPLFWQVSHLEFWTFMKPNRSRFSYIISLKWALFEYRIHHSYTWFYFQFFAPLGCIFDYWFILIDLKNISSQNNIIWNICADLVYLIIILVPCRQNRRTWKQTICWSINCIQLALFDNNYTHLLGNAILIN